MVSMRGDLAFTLDIDITVLASAPRIDAATEILLVELASVLLLTKHHKAKLTERDSSWGFCQY